MITTCFKKYSYTLWFYNSLKLNMKQAFLGLLGICFYSGPTPCSTTFPSIRPWASVCCAAQCTVHTGQYFENDCSKFYFFKALGIPLRRLLRRFAPALGYGLYWGCGDVSFLFEVVAQIWLNPVRGFWGRWSTWQFDFIIQIFARLKSKHFS